jgi:hypothetical protein
MSNALDTAITYLPDSFVRGTVISESLEVEELFIPMPSLENATSIF